MFVIFFCSEGPHLGKADICFNGIAAPGAPGPVLTACGGRPVCVDTAFSVYFAKLKSSAKKKTMPAALPTRGG
jgi:hypothetical protein